MNVILVCFSYPVFRERNGLLSTPPWWRIC